jgi:NADH-quinone oxidoreductase subunit K
VSVPTSHILLLSGVLFAIGVAGVYLRRNVIVVLMSVELMLNAANLAFLAGSRQHSSSSSYELTGPIFVIFVITIAAIEAAVGLALVIALYRRKQVVSLDMVNELKD